VLVLVDSGVGWYGSGHGGVVVLTFVVVWPRVLGGVQ